MLYYVVQYKYSKVNTDLSARQYFVKYLSKKKHYLLNTFQMDIKYLSKNTAIPVFKRYYLVPTYTKSKKEALALEVFTEMFGDPLTGMLFEEFVKNKSKLLAVNKIH